MSHHIGASVAAGFLLALAGCQVQTDNPAPHKMPAASEAPTVASPDHPTDNSISNSAGEETKFEELVFRKMQEKVAWHLTNEKLGDVLGRLRKELGVNVVLDKHAFEFSPAHANEPITQDFDGVTRELALDLVLRPYQMDWTVVGNAILVSSRDIIDTTLTTRVYDVDDILAGGDFDDSDIDSLIDAIESNVLTDTWSENGVGEADLRPFRVHGKCVLIVTQSRRAHQGIRQLLNDLRSVHGKTPQQTRTSTDASELSKKLAVLRDINGSEPKERNGAAHGTAEIPGLLLQSDELKDAVLRNNQFSIDLFRKCVSDSSRNDLVSGYSAREALVLAASGAKGETQAELANVLRLPNDRRQVGVEALSLRSYVHSAQSAGSVFEVANGLWVQQELDLKDDYSMLAERFMGATARSIDFRRDAEALDAINGWVADKTRHRIPKILNADDISPQTYVVLANAAYFLGKWQTAFDAKKTVASDFTLSDGTKAQVEMMNGKTKARYALDTDSGLQIAELPYRDQTKALIVLLPPQGNNGLAQLIQELDASKLEKWIAATKRSDVSVRFPKFSFRAGHDLRKSLAALGGERMFNLATADFSGITNNPVALQTVKQLAFIQVDESGTEAAAVTVGGFFGGAARSPSPELIVDRPFLVLIRDLTTGCILFVGQIADPRASE